MTTLYHATQDDARRAVTLASRYVGADALAAAILRAAELAPEFDPVESDATRGRYFSGPALARPVEFAGPMADGTGGFCFERMTDGEDWHGPLMPLPSDRFVSFHYAAPDGSARGRWTAPNVRGRDAKTYGRPSALLALAERVKGAALAFDGKARKAPTLARVKGSQPHVTARALYMERDYLGALQVCEASGEPVYFGAATVAKDGTAPPMLYMRPERVILAGVGFVVGRRVDTGRFHVSHELSGRRIDGDTVGPVGGKGFASGAAALAWIESAMAEDAFADKLRGAAAKCPDVCQAAERARVECGAEPAEPDACEGAESGASGANEPAEVAAAPESVASAPSADPGPSLADACLERFGVADPDACRHLPAFAELARAVGAEPAGGAPVAAPSAPSGAATVRHVSAAEWQAATGERTSGDDACQAAGAILAECLAAIGTAPSPRLALALECAADGDPGARAAIRAALVDVAANPTEPGAAMRACEALAILAAPTEPEPTPCYANPTEPADPPATHSRATPVLGSSNPPMVSPVYSVHVRTYAKARELAGVPIDAPYVSHGAAIDSAICAFRRVPKYRNPAALELRARVARVVRAERRAARRAKAAANALHVGRVYPLAVFPGGARRTDVRVRSIRHTGFAIDWTGATPKGGDAVSGEVTALRMLAAIRRGERATARAARSVPPATQTRAKPVPPATHSDADDAAEAARLARINAERAAPSASTRFEDMTDAELRAYIDGCHRTRSYGIDFEHATRVLNDRTGGGAALPPATQTAPTIDPRAVAAFNRICAQVAAANGGTPTARALAAEAERVHENAETMARAKASAAGAFRELASMLAEAAHIAHLTETGQPAGQARAMAAAAIASDAIASAMRTGRAAL